MCLEKYLNRLKGDFNYVLINIEIEGMMQKKKLELEFAFVGNTKLDSLILEWHLMQTWIWCNTTSGMTYDCLIWNSPYSNTTPPYFKFRVKILKMIGCLEWLAITQDLLYFDFFFPKRPLILIL